MVDEQLINNQKRNSSLTQSGFYKKEVIANNSMVATKDRLASEAAIEVLKSGGNAIDAAIVAFFVLSVVEPYSS